VSTRLEERPEAQPVDPRIAARRDAVAADSRRRRWRRWTVVAGVVAVVAGAWYVTRTPLFDVDSIEIVGVSRTSPDAVAAASGVLVGAALTDVDADRVRKGVEPLPWVDQVTVERGLDGTVVITVTERTAIATAVTVEGLPVVVDADGRVLAGVSPDTGLGVDPALVPIEGVSAPGPGGTLDTDSGGALDVVGRLGPALRQRVAAVVVGPAGDLTLTLRPQGVADLGPATLLDAKLSSLVTVLSQVDQSGLAVVGLRVPDLPTVTRA